MRWGPYIRTDWWPHGYRTTRIDVACRAAWGEVGRGPISDQLAMHHDTINHQADIPDDDLDTMAPGEICRFNHAVVMPLGAREGPGHITPATS
jgi:hypothetical protein